MFLFDQGLNKDEKWKHVILRVCLGFAGLAISLYLLRGDLATTAKWFADRDIVFSDSYIAPSALFGDGIPLEAAVIALFILLINYYMGYLSGSVAKTWSTNCRTFLDLVGAFVRKESVGQINQEKLMYTFGYILTFVVDVILDALARNGGTNDFFTANGMYNLVFSFCFWGLGSDIGTVLSFNFIVSGLRLVFTKKDEFVPEEPFAPGSQARGNLSRGNRGGGNRGGMGFNPTNHRSD